MDATSSLQLSSYLTPEFTAGLVRAVLVVSLGLPIFYFLSKWLKRIATKKFSAHGGMILSRAVFYLGVVGVVISVMKELGFSLAPLLGAAGVAGVALGFASQTSVSNVVSGLFLLTEEPYRLGEVVTIGGVTGEVFSIDLLSVKLRLFDNRYVRISNESLIKSEITNLTRFPIRRLDINLGLAYKEDVGRVRAVLLDLARKNPLALQEPEPIIIFTGFGNSSIDLIFGVWVAREDFLNLKNTLQEEIKSRFDREGIEIPFPHLSLYSGSATEPFPIKLVNQADRTRLPGTRVNS
jgi:small-conductance mechanosensitive channel